METQTVTVGGLNFAYRWDGPVGAPVAMMAHAMGTSLRIWDRQVAALADRYRLLRYDWRGHGGSAAPPGCCESDCGSTTNDSPMAGPWPCRRLGWRGLPPPLPRTR